MKKFFSFLTIFALTVSVAGCNADDEVAPRAKEWVQFIEKEVTATGVEFEIVPTNNNIEYSVYIVPQNEFDPSSVPGDATYATGKYTARYDNLENRMRYYLVVNIDAYNYTTKLLVVPGATGTYTPKGHPSDFNIREIPTKQKRSEKRGLSGNLQASDPAQLGKGVSWSYNWSGDIPAITPQLDAQDMIFYPMAWNGLGETTAANIKTYASSHPKAKYVLGFNEPNLSDQANMTPSQCGPKWNSLKALVATTGLKLISPALNYGTLAGYNDPVKWMDEFLTQPDVSLNDFEAIALHCYMPNVGGMRSMIHKFEKYGKPIYMTEFCHANDKITEDQGTQLAFMSNILDYLETDPMVEAYSWFISRGWDGIKLFDGYQLNKLGELYVNFSSFDKTCYYKEGEPIPAAHYVAHNMSDKPATTNWENTLIVTPTTDFYGDLMLSAYQPGGWVEYQIAPSKSKTYALAIRFYSTAVKGTFDLSIDGEVVQEIEFPKDEVWETLWVEDLKLTAGKHTLRLTCKSGRTDINWLYLD